MEIQGYETGDQRLLAALAGFSSAATAFTLIAPRVAFGFPVTSGLHRLGVAVEMQNCRRGISDSHTDT